MQPDFNKQLEEIQNNRPELVAIKSVVTELQNVQKELSRGATDQTTISREQVATLKTLESALKELLDKPEKELDVSTVVSELKSLSEGLKSVQKAVQSIDVKPQVNVPAPTVNMPAPKVTIPKIDLSKLEKLITSLPEAISRLIPESPEPDLSPLTSSMGDLKTVMEEVRDRPIPIPQAPTQVKVVNADGSSVANVNLKQSNTILFAPVSVSASGDSAVVALVSAKKIKVLSVLLVASGTVSVKWRSNTTDLSGAMPFVANSGFVLPASSPGQGHYFETAAGEALNINLSGAVAVTGHISYYTEA